MDTTRLKDYFTGLQSRIVSELEAFDGQSFRTDSWDRPEGGGGLSRLIEDLRVLSLADSGHLNLHLERSDLAAEILRIASLLEPELVAAGFRLRLRLEAAPVLCDVTRIRQIVMALLDNVRRYAQPGEITISCRLGGIGSSKQILIAHVVKTDFLPGCQCGGIVLNLIRLIGYRTMLPGVRLSLFGLKPCIQRHTG